MKLRLGRKPAGRGWSPSLTSTQWGESTFAEQSWGRSRNASTRWALAGGVLGALLATLAFAPATWLADAVASASGQRFLLAEARGTVWSGSAVPVLTGGPGSRDAAALPGRFSWTVRLAGTALEVRASQACCLNGSVAVRLNPGFSRVSATLVQPADWVGQWPTAWLTGLGTPWNTMQFGGSARLTSPGVTVEWVAGRWRVEGQAEVELIDVSSRLSTLEPLGSYRLRVLGDPSNAGQPQLSLSTQDGTLQLSGSGAWGPGGLRFRGEARAAANEAALSNLLNIIGRRDGARSVIAIG